MSGSRSRVALAAAVIAAVSACNAATAGDLEPRLGQIRGYSWQGPYVGANLGYQ